MWGELTLLLSSRGRLLRFSCVLLDSLLGISNQPFEIHKAKRQNCLEQGTSGQLEERSVGGLALETSRVNRIESAPVLLLLLLARVMLSIDSRFQEGDTSSMREKPWQQC